ncbi:CAP domain-containing protein [uncultured Massilia sp.]|uniref:CAP domain-containing protein n=1 Tax=uncultured Massilia sp. TaxID=169973 RepID=UPI0025DA8318|nr:CAP domain-containing protein [uncultured Massilia sp.]
MSKLHRARAIAAALAAALALAACGGNDNTNDGSNTGNAGGSSGAPSGGFSGVDANAPTLTNNVATDGLAWINYRRTQVGMSTLARNGRIDIAAQGHSDYQRINNTVTHDQTAGRQGFTGVTLQDRLAAANYTIQGANAIGEVISAASNNSGFYMAEELITAIYHRFVIFEPVFKEAGTGAAAASNGYNYFTADFAASNGFGAGIAAGTLATWPFNGQAQVPPNFLSDQEEPDPVPNQNEVGYPVSVHTNLTRTLTVQTFTIRARGAASDMSTRLLAYGKDTNTTTRSAAAIVPLARLAAATTYDVTFIGAIDGTAVSRTWSFTTR